ISQLIGLQSPEVKEYFLNFPSEKFNSIIKKAGELENVILKSGVYHYTKGPSYETPAEIEMMRKFGSDAVGMSTVHEAVMASVFGIEVAAISCITNMGAGILNGKLNHKEVTETAEKVKGEFTRLIKRIIINI
ncbi:MAG TPA: purine-nucleoside phosphorylase, partial [Ignavibacteriaceae bacterium]